ncbi:MAG: hypothetical protein NT090_00115 [Acidobacteria bacterium]|nr:hypothetical protein [Acidobacteriota bacterium]
MAKTEFANLVLNVRLDSKQRALKEAVLVPWRQLEESAVAYAEWHIFVLWVRVIAETEGRLPAIVRSALEARCPGFLECENPERRDIGLLWKSLEEWVTANRFAEARAGGWFDAVMYYAYKDLRTEQAWSLWERTRAAWHDNRPARWPTLEEWTAEVLATRALAQTGTEKARAVEALARVEPERLRKAVSNLLESRAFALWVDCVSKPEQALDESVSTELRCRYPSLLSASCPDPLWLPSLFARLVRVGETDWSGVARAEGWYAALRYRVVHHPRYQRLIHYNQRCHDEWRRARPISWPSFADWLSVADAYFVGREA